MITLLFHESMVLGISLEKLSEIVLESQNNFDGLVWETNSRPSKTSGIA